MIQLISTNLFWGGEDIQIEDNQMKFKAWHFAIKLEKYV